jgi:hypothetical protein
MRSVPKILRAIIALYLTAAVAVVVFSELVRGSRRDQIRRFNRNTLNPWMMRRAGGEHWYASVVKHVGRASGTQYETPVVMLAVDGHLAIPLPYGDDVDWLENLQYAGGGAALHKGAEYVLTDPVIVSRAAIAESLGHRDAFRYRVLGIDEFVKLRAERIVAESAVAV